MISSTSSGFHSIKLTPNRRIRPHKPVPQVCVEGERYVSHQQDESEIKQADCPAEAPESSSDECETYNTQ